MLRASFVLFSVTYSYAVLAYAMYCSTPLGTEPIEGVADHSMMQRYSYTGFWCEAWPLRSWHACLLAALRCLRYTPAKTCGSAQSLCVPSVPCAFPSHLTVWLSCRDGRVVGAQAGEMHTYAKTRFLTLLGVPEQYLVLVVAEGGRSIRTSFLSRHCTRPSLP